MAIELIKPTSTPNWVCHFCGCSKTSYETVQRGYLRLCRECLFKHPVVSVLQLTEEIDEPVDKE
jgi:hypothetical protein